MFFRYKKKYKKLATDSAVAIQNLTQAKLRALKDHATCKDHYQLLFEDFKQKEAIIKTIKEIRAGGKFTGKQGAEIDKLIR